MSMKNCLLNKCMFNKEEKTGKIFTPVVKWRYVSLMSFFCGTRFNMALGGLYHRAGMERPAVTCFREVLK